MVVLDVSFACRLPDNAPASIAASPDQIRFADRFPRTVRSKQKTIGEPFVEKALERFVDFGIVDRRCRNIEGLIQTVVAADAQSVSNFPALLGIDLYFVRHRRGKH